MSKIFSAEELRTMFQSSFCMQSWYNCLQNLFNASELKVTPEKINNNTLENGYYLGNIDTVDSYRIGLFYYKITQGSVAKRKIGLRNFVRSFINPTWGEFEAALVVFDSGDLWRLSFICDIKGEATSPKRYTYVFGNQGILYRTPIERFRFLQNKGVSFENFKTAFSVEALSDEFFNRYREQYADFIQYITGKRFIKVGGKWEEKVLGLPNDSLMQAFEFNEKKIRDYIKKMMGRLTFLHFLQRKGWLCGDLNYLQNLFVRSQYQDDYLDSVLEPLFFGILNTKPEGRKQIFEQYNWDMALLKEWESIPYLNGGLFERDKEDEPESKFPADYFKRLFQFFSEYNFTIDENDPNDAEVGVDPEMLGKIFENLLEDNKDKGAFYTPKEIVRYMCQESLIAYLETNTSIAKEKIRQFVLVPDENVEEIPENKRIKLLEALKDVKICDPAIGSGAFPMGLLNELLNCREALEHLDVPRSEIKKSIIQNNIYGVDIEKGAVDIARLRFWLSIVVDEENASPLPNLDYKIMQGNSLIECYKGLDLSKLTYEKEGKKDSGEVELFDDEKKQMQKRLSIWLSKYYSCSDHDEKERIKQEIFETIYLQLKQLAYSDAILSELKNINFAENNQFFLWHTWFSDVFNRPNGKSGFDIVIGNPPYVKEYTNRKAFDGFRETSPYYIGKMDLWYAFACHCIDLLCEKGLLCFIAQNNWTTSSGAKKMRRKVIEETQILQLLDFNTYMVFENADIQTMIMMFERNSLSDNYKFDYRKITDSNDKEDMLALLVREMHRTEYITPTIERKLFIDKLLTFSINNNILDKIADNKYYLFDDEIAQGIVFPQDFLDKKRALEFNGIYPVGTGIFGLSNFEKEALNLNSKELELIKPYYTSEQINRYYTDIENNLWLIYTDSSFKYPEKMRTYPNIKNHLDRFSRIFTSDNKPYGLHRCRKEYFFQGEKILSLRKCPDKPCFSYSDFDCYVTQTYFSIKTTRWNLKFLTGVLNSKLIAYWLKEKGKMQGKNYQIDKDPLLSTPLPLISLEGQENIINLVDIIIRNKRENPNVDISENESKIDKLVYQLYGLTDTEIKIIEESV